MKYIILPIKCFDAVYLNPNDEDSEIISREIYYSNCFQNLEEIEKAYEIRGEGLCVCLKNGDSYISSISFEEFNLLIHKHLSTDKIYHNLYRKKSYN